MHCHDRLQDALIRKCRGGTLVVKHASVVLYMVFQYLSGILRVGRKEETWKVGRFPSFFGCFFGRFDLREAPTHEV